VNEKFKSNALFATNIVLFTALLLFLVSWIFHEIRAKGDQSPITELNVQGEKRHSDVIQIEVLNGCGVSRLALTMTNFLRSNSDFDVVDFKTYERSDIPETLVIDRISMDTKMAKKVGSAIGVDSRCIFPQVCLSRNADVTIIIGADYQSLKAFR
jgi:hypothetical protein